MHNNQAAVRVVILILLFFLPLSTIFSIDVYSYYLENKESYESVGDRYAEYQIKQLFELAMLVNDSVFCRKLIQDYSLKNDRKPSDDLNLLFFRFAYKANDPDLIEDLFRIIPLSIKMHLETAHHLYIEIISSDNSDKTALTNLKNVLTYLPDNFQSFYNSLLENREYYLYFSPMTFNDQSYTSHTEAPDSEDKLIREQENVSEEKDIKPEDDSISETENAAEKGSAENTYIQVGSFSVLENAEEIVKELKLRNFNASISSKEVQGSKYYRVIVLVESGYTVDEYLSLLYEHGYGGIKY
jgi:hypothetical protein